MGCSDAQSSLLRARKALKPDQRMKAQKSEGCTAPLRLLERSVFSDRMVFVRAVHEAKWLSEMELGIYDSW